MRMRVLLPLLMGPSPNSNVCRWFLSIADRFPVPRLPLALQTKRADHRKERFQPTTIMMMAGQNVTKNSRPKPIGFGLGSRENRITANKGVMPAMSRISPAQNSLLILKAASRSWRVYARLRLWSLDSRRAFKKSEIFSNRISVRGFSPNLRLRRCDPLRGGRGTRSGAGKDKPLSRTS